MMEGVVGMWKEVAGISEVKEARIVSVREGAQEEAWKDIMVEVTWSSRNLAKKERTLISSNYLVPGREEAAPVFAFPPLPLVDHLLVRRTSNSGKLTACMVGAAGAKGEEESEGEHITITHLDGTFTSYDLAAADKHGKVYADPEFSGLEFSPDETKLTYIAEKKRAKAASFFAAPPKSGEEDMRGQEFAYHDDWGEQLVGKSQSVVCVLDLATGNISAHTLPDGLCPGQVSFVPAGVVGNEREWAVIGVGFASLPYRLGLVYCQNRLSRLFHLDSQGNFELVGSEGYNLQCPRWCPDGSQLAFLRAEVGGPHAKVAQLCLLSWPHQQERVLVDVMNRRSECETKPVFRGVNGSTGLPHHCWASDASSIVFSALTLDTIATFTVCTQSGVVTGVGDGECSQRVWDGCSDVLLVEEMSLCSPSRLVLLPHPHPHRKTEDWKRQVTVKREGGLPESHLSRWVITNPNPHPDSKYSDLPISLMYLGPPSCTQDSAKRPLIVLPHGGPHSCSTNTYSVQCAFFTRLGFCVLLPNYRGSLGAGQDGVMSLLGHCGVTDVSDVHQATLSCLERFSGVIDEKQVFLFGGSHGGFLVTHLAAQHPNMYKAVAARNPVTDIPTMTGLSDINDWCFVETGNDYHHGKVPDTGTLCQMHAASPISRLATMTAPLLLLVGEEDRRVPPSQALVLYKALLARGVDTRLHMYPDCHPLSKVTVEADCFIHTALWFLKHGATPTPIPVSAS